MPAATDKHNREAFAYELTQLWLATIIVNVSVTFENLPVAWKAYKRDLPWTVCLYKWE